MKDNPELAKMLLNGGAKINRLNPSGKTALNLAMEQLTRPTRHDSLFSDHEKAGEMVKLLLECGANVNQLMQSITVINIIVG